MSAHERVDGRTWKFFKIPGRKNMGDMSGIAFVPGKGRAWARRKVHKQERRHQQKIIKEEVNRVMVNDTHDDYQSMFPQDDFNSDILMHMNLYAEHGYKTYEYCNCEKCMNKREEVETKRLILMEELERQWEEDDRLHREAQDYFTDFSDYRE